MAGNAFQTLRGINQFAGGGVAHISVFEFRVGVQRLINGHADGDSRDHFAQFVHVAGRIAQRFSRIFQYGAGGKGSERDDLRDAGFFGMS